MSDPHEVLGVPPGAPVTELRAARRRLARELHPDRTGGDSHRMQAVNEAFDQLMALPSDPPAPPSDVTAFSLDRLPVEAYELVVLAAAQLGDVWLVDEPYHLELLLAEPPGAGCTLELVPDAGGSTVTVDVDPPSLNGNVRDRLISELHRL